MASHLTTEQAKKTENTWDVAKAALAACLIQGNLAFEKYDHSDQQMLHQSGRAMALLSRLITKQLRWKRQFTYCSHVSPQSFNTLYFAHKSTVCNFPTRWQSGNRKVSDKFFLQKYMRHSSHESGTMLSSEGEWHAAILSFLFSPLWTNEELLLRIVDHGKTQSPSLSLWNYS